MNSQEYINRCVKSDPNANRVFDDLCQRLENDTVSKTYTETITQAGVERKVIVLEIRQLTTVRRDDETFDFNRVEVILREKLKSLSWDLRSFSYDKFSESIDVIIRGF